MSKSRGCVVVRWTDKKWYCIVAREEYDYGFDDFSIYGPANTEDEAYDAMLDNECNAGSSHRVVCKAQKDLTPSHLVQAMRKFIKNGYRNPSFKSETVIRSRRAW